MTALRRKALVLEFNSKQPQARARPDKAVACQLRARGWNDAARRALQRILRQGAGRGLPVVFDFDNTIISGDVGEAVLAVLAASRRLVPENICPTLCPAVSVPGKGRIEVRDCADIMEYYEALLSPTVHGKADPTPLANAYVWATQALENLSLREVLQATATAFETGRSDGSAQIEATRGGTKYPAPRFREEFVELIAELLRLDFEPWIVSASNVWSVRWMVVHGLNPRLAQRGLGKGLPPERVIGLATLLVGPAGRLYKDSVLVRDHPRYAAFKTELLDSLRVTRQIQFPAPVYSGKVACILDALGRNPYLCAGDSPSDHAMMGISRHRLWIARPDKPAAQRATRAFIQRTGKERWILQACAGLAAGRPGLVAGPCVLEEFK